MPGTSLVNQLDSATGLETSQKSTSNAAWVQVQGTLELPVGAVALNSSSGNVAAGSAVATFPAVAAKTNFVTGFEITGGGATGAALVVATLVGLLGGTASYIVAAVAGATLGNTPLVVQFSKAMPASAVNVALVLTLPSLGVGNTNAAVSMHGYLL